MFDAVLTTALFLTAVYASKDGAMALFLIALLAIANGVTSSNVNVGEELKCVLGM